MRVVNMMRTCLADNFFGMRTPIFCLFLLRFCIAQTDKITDNVLISNRSFDWNETLSEFNDMLSNKENCQVPEYQCSNRLYKQTLCDCSEECMKYGGCCINTAAQERNRGIDPDDEKYVCGSTHNFERDRGVVMIGNCHPNFAGNPQIEEFCFRNPKYSNITYAYLIDIPAISVTTNVTYVNYYCAFCNNDADKLFPMKQFKIVCNQNIKTNKKRKKIQDVLREFISETHYDLHKRLWTTRTSHERMTCFLQNILYESNDKITRLHETKSCQYAQVIKEATDNLKYINQCNSSWPNEEDIQKCKMYSAKLIDGENLRLYKNPHCARCNFANISSPQMHCAGFPLNAIRWRKSITYTIPINSSRRTVCTNANIWDPIQEKCFAIPSKLMLFIWTMSINAYRPFLPAFLDNTYLEFVVTLISEFCLFLHIFLFFRNNQHRRYETILLCLCICLFIANLLIFAKMAIKEKNIFWIPVVRVLQYFWSVSFFWMNVLSVDMFRTFSSRTRVILHNKKQNMILYNIYSWGVPLLLVLLVYVIVHILYPHDNGETNRFVPTFLVPAEYLDVNSHINWLANSVLFLIPITIIVLVNFILLLVTSCKIYKKSKETELLYLRSREQAMANGNSGNQLERRKRRKNYVRPSLYIKLGLLQGCTWVVWILACCLNEPILLAISQAVNGLQGAYILFSFDLQKMASWSSPAWQQITTRFKDISSGDKSTNL